VSAPGPAPGREGPDEPAAPEEDAAPQRRWVWMDRWDPGTWEMPSNPTRTQRVMAGVCLIIILVMTIYVPFKILGVF
jgi:hypothetical protein